MVGSGIIGGGNIIIKMEWWSVGFEHSMLCAASTLIPHHTLTSSIGTTLITSMPMKTCSTIISRDKSKVLVPLSADNL
jgi:hypothetical protein